MKAKFAILLIIIAVTFSCQERKEATQENEVLEQTTHKTEKHWSYEGETGAEHWKEFEKESDCGGEFQSPINIVDIAAVYEPNLNELEIHYGAATKILDVTNNGHSIQYNFEKEDYINFNGDKYELNQIHFHEASEHTINGIRFPMEIHFVHLNKDNKITVLGVLVQEGKSSSQFEFLETYLPLNVGETKEINMPFDLNLNLPLNKDYYSYAGSLTTPPCSEGVNWFVFKEPITISLEPVEKIRAFMTLNHFRNEQKMNGRIVKKTFK